MVLLILTFEVLQVKRTATLDDSVESNIEYTVI